MAEAMTPAQWSLLVRFMFWVIYGLNRINGKYCGEFEAELNALRDPPADPDAPQNPTTWPGPDGPSGLTGDKWTHVAPGGVVTKLDSAWPQDHAVVDPGPPDYSHLKVKPPIGYAEPHDPPPAVPPIPNLTLPYDPVQRYADRAARVNATLSDQQRALLRDFWRELQQDLRDAQRGAGSGDPKPDKPLR